MNVVDQPCAICNRPKWWHIHPLRVRQQDDRNDNGHPFRPLGLEGVQLGLPFGVMPMKRPMNSANRAAAAEGKKPLRAGKAAAISAEKRKSA